MGLYINLTVNILDLSPAKWEKTYQESCRLLEHFPVPLMRFKSEESYKHQRYMYTADVISQKGSQEEHWSVSGDLVSGQSGESFTLHRYLDQQFAYFAHPRYQKNPPWQDNDVLWASEDKIDYADGNGVDIFRCKTQGRPYHLALLAVGVLFESRFPKQVYVWGDYDHYQAENMVKWANTVLDDPVTMPVCLDGERLYQRLRETYDKPQLAIQRFQLLYRGSEEEGLQILLTLADKEALLQRLIQGLRRYQSLSQLGVINQLAQFLNVTGEIKQLISLVMVAGPGEKFPLEELLRILCKHFITISEAEREPLGVFAYRGEQLMTIEDLFSRVFVTMKGGMPWAVQFYMSEAELLEVFCSYEPTKRALFEQIIQKGAQTCRETLEKIETLLNQMQEEEVTEQKHLTQRVVVLEEAESEPEKRDPLPEIAYIRGQVESQTRSFAEPIEAAQTAGQQLQQIISQHPQMFASDEKTREAYLENISLLSYHHSIILRESAWQRIDAETKLTYLKSLLALVAIPDQSTFFNRWRQYFLEHPELWPYLAAEPMIDSIQPPD